MPGTLLGYFSLSLKNSNNACIEFKNSYSTIKVIIKLGGPIFLKRPDQFFYLPHFLITCSYYNCLVLHFWIRVFGFFFGR